MGFQFTETDSGTKEATGKAIEKTGEELHKNFIESMKEYWWKVYETAKQLCLQYVYSGPDDPKQPRTGTLYDSIRLIWQYEPSGGLYEVAASSSGIEMMAMIKVGGQEYINPRTGKPCNYAQAVHDGTMYMAARPFLIDAIAICEPFLDEIMQKYTDEALSAFERDY